MKDQKSKIETRNVSNEAYNNVLNFGSPKTEWLQGGLKHEGGKLLLVIELTTQLKKYFRLNEADGKYHISFTFIRKGEGQIPNPPTRTQDYYLTWLMVNQDQVWPTHQPHNNRMTIAKSVNEQKPLAKMSFTLSEHQLLDAGSLLRFDDSNVRCAVFEVVVAKDRRVGIFKIQTPQKEIEDFISGTESIKNTYAKDIFEGL